MNQQLPHDLEILEPELQKFEETVVLVPFFRGKKTHLKRHALWLSELGFKVGVFQLANPPQSVWDGLKSIPIARSGDLGLKHIWADQIEDVLNALPGSKIIYSFSNPTGSSIEAIRRRGATDVKGLVADSGPSGKLLESFVNYYTVEEPIRWSFQRMAKAAVMVGIWSQHGDQGLQNDLKKLPADFPILSIQGWKDPLIPPHLIDHAWDNQTHLKIQKLSLAEASHLNGLKDFPKEYKKVSESFLGQLVAKQS